MPASVGGAVILGEGDLHVARLARPHADQLLGEAGDEAGTVDLDRHVGRGAAREGLALARLAFGRIRPMKSQTRMSPFSAAAAPR